MWNLNGDGEMVMFLVPQLTMVVSSVAFYNYLPTSNQPTSKLLIDK